MGLAARDRFPGSGRSSRSRALAAVTPGPLQPSHAQGQARVGDSAASASGRLSPSVGSSRRAFPKDIRSSGPTGALQLPSLWSKGGHAGAGWAQRSHLLRVAEWRLTALAGARVFCPQQHWSGPEPGRVHTPLSVCLRQLAPQKCLADLLVCALATPPPWNTLSSMPPHSPRTELALVPSFG